MPSAEFNAVVEALGARPPSIPVDVHGARQAIDELMGSAPLADGVTVEPVTVAARRPSGSARRPRQTNGSCSTCTAARSVSVRCSAYRPFASQLAVALGDAAARGRLSARARAPLPRRPRRLRCRLRVVVGNRLAQRPGCDHGRFRGWRTGGVDAAGRQAPRSSSTGSRCLPVAAGRSDVRGEGRTRATPRAIRTSTSRPPPKRSATTSETVTRVDLWRRRSSVILPISRRSSSTRRRTKCSPTTPSHSRHASRTAADACSSTCGRR